MGSIFEGYQIYGTSNDDLHLGLGYINYDRESDVDLSELIIEFNRINGPSTGGSYRIVEGGNVWSFTIFIAVKANSPWTNVKFTWTVNSNDGRGISVRDGFTVLDGLPHPDLGIDYGTTIIAGEQYNWASFPQTIRGYADFSRSDNVEDFGKNSAGFGVPWYDKTKEPLNNLNGVNALNYIVTHNLEPDNQEILDGDYGITTWTVYHYSDNFKCVWKNDFVEDNGLASTAIINVYALKSGETEYVKIADYKYEDAYFTMNFKDICRIVNPISYNEYLQGRYPYSQLEGVTIKLQLESPSGSPLNRYATFWFNYENLILESGVNGDVINVFQNQTGDDDNGYIDRESIIEEIDYSTYDATNLLTTTYVMNKNQLGSFGSELWDASFIDSIRLVNLSPIDNVVSCFILPFTPVKGESSPVVVGNFRTNITANRINDNGIKLVCSFVISKYYNTFMDFQPYTDCYIYLPCMGLTSIDIKKLDNKTIDVVYVVDYMSGECVITLRNNNVILEQYECNIGITVQLSSSNASNERAKSVMGMLSTNPLDVVQNVTSNILTPRGISRNGNFSLGAIAKNSLDIYIFYVRPQYQEPLNYAHAHGKPCNLTRTISTLQGYTKCASNVDLSGIPCTESQRQMIFDRLTSGFYV